MARPSYKGNQRGKGQGGRGVGTVDFYIPEVSTDISNTFAYVKGREYGRWTDTTLAVWEKYLEYVNIVNEKG